MFPKVICYVVLPRFTGNIVSILYNTWDNLNSMYIKCFNIWAASSLLWRAESLLWREAAAMKCLLSLCALSCWKLVEMIWLKIFCINMIFAVLAWIQVLYRAHLFLFPLYWTPLYLHMLNVEILHLYCNAAACYFIATVMCAYYVLCIKYFICKGIWPF